MITPYYGEFLLSTPPLELSMNHCSHKCGYCFANLNQPKRRAAPQSIINLLSEMDERKTLEARLLQMRYPVLISNKVDGFAQSNYRLTLQILEVMAALKIPVQFQTKGGPGLIEAMDLIQPSCFYFSITASDDETAKRIEPGAPTITERFEMMAKVRARGHHVWAGVNPLVRQWIPDVKSFCKRLADSGVTNIWSEVLHLSRDQVQEMSPRERENISEPIIKEAMQRGCSKESYAHEMDLIDACAESGIDFCSKHWPSPSTALNAYARCYPRRFPSMTEFTNHAWATMKPGDQITFGQFADFFEPQLPKIRSNELIHYIGSCSRVLMKKLVFVDPPDYRDLLRIVWDEREHRMNPSRSFAFKKVFTERDGQKVFQLDSAGAAVRYFTARKLERR
jgi:DNA repair photolyase